MFCTKCGAPIEEGGNFCSSCGAVVEIDDEVVDNAQPVNESEEHSKNIVQTVYSNKKLFTICCVVLASIVLIIALVCALLPSGGAKTPKKAIETFCEAYYKQDASKMVSVLSQYSKNYIMDSPYGENATDKEVKKRIELVMTDDESVKLIDVEILEIDFADRDDLEDFIYDYISVCGYDKKEKIEAFVDAKIEITYSEDGEIDSDTEWVSCCCVNDRWYMVMGY